MTFPGWGSRFDERVHWLWEAMQSPITDVASVYRRTSWLIGIHLVLSAAATAVLGLLVWRVRLLVTLTQRSNVETLVLAFIAVFVVYLLVSTLPSTMGSLRLLALRLGGVERAQPRLQERARHAPRATKRAYLNVIVRGPDNDTIDVPIEDRWGRIGTLRLDGGEIALVDVPEHLSHSPLTLAVTALRTVGVLDGTDSAPQIVAWGGIDAEGAERYGSGVRAWKRLEQALGAPLWPAVRVDEAGVGRIATLMRDATAALREDVLLPDIEYSAEFTIPIIPEPLALMQVKREQQHADPVATLGCATLVVLSLLAILVWMIIHPPWVPGK